MGCMGERQAADRLAQLEAEKKALEEELKKYTDKYGDINACDHKKAPAHYSIQEKGTPWICSECFEEGFGDRLMCIGVDGRRYLELKALKALEPTNDKLQGDLDE